MSVFVFGSNAISQLGLGEDEGSTHVPTRLSFFDGMSLSKVRCGSLHTLVLDTSGTLYSWGCNDEGALGRGGDESTPEKVCLQEKVVDMDCGASISAALTSSGHVYVWGTFRSTNGTFGLTPSEGISFEPVKVPLKNIRALSAGQSFIAALDSKDVIYTFGSNEFGELGRRTSERNKLRALIPDAVTTPRKRLQNHRFKSIASGLNHLIALNTDGEAYCWGSNLYGQLGHDKAESTFNKYKVPLDGISQAVGGENHSLFVTKDGSLYGSGRNKEGQLGIQNVENLKSPTKLGLSGVEAVRSYNSFSIGKVGNELYSWGTGFNGALGHEEETLFEPKKIPYEFPEVIDFDVGNDFSVVVTK
ncbi:alpha-tubulin suppressor-like protein [Encephalitozoon intestinalis ATCC 50506]|uniref:Alpha-tubulin suppressor-like protein n=1 Tax=Encephalitozoon intestinalis (strain ATCC 50506) TaxID=876142 RepID=E0S6V3_ENCIT|nr:alpha-tubulin suppressor-like protein [Encephalitozoon intestinalis ATCC 50506]ADM11438.1 alpha-tubulin suppressor-like protein [Encephalitozoon intestinalis ATCC 50506]UTX45134.1 chromatin-binding protein BJ1 [Encephalitozoon intestinalis]